MFKFQISNIKLKIAAAANELNQQPNKRMNEQHATETRNTFTV